MERVITTEPLTHYDQFNNKLITREFSSIANEELRRLYRILTSQILCLSYYARMCEKFPIPRTPQQSFA